METMFAAAAILSPLGLTIAFVLPTIAIMFARREFSAPRLAAGYVGALCALALAIAATAYVSHEDAASMWQVPPDRYWGGLIDLFVGMFVTAAFAAIVGISFVGIPVLVWLFTVGKATAPWLILTAIAISGGVAALLYGLMHHSSSIRFLDTLALLVASHAVCAAGFALAARLPWSFRSAESSTSAPQR